MRTTTKLSPTFDRLDIRLSPSVGVGVLAAPSDPLRPPHVAAPDGDPEAPPLLTETQRRKVINGQLREMWEREKRDRHRVVPLPDFPPPPPYTVTRPFYERWVDAVDRALESAIHSGTPLFHP